MFENRNLYRRDNLKKGLTPFEITVKETNLNIQARCGQADLPAMKDRALRAALDCRQYIEAQILSRPEFADSLTPVARVPYAPGIIQEMTKAAAIARVGPMAAVAGAVAEYVGRDLMELSREVFVENGGDIFISSDSKTLISIYAGDSPFSMTCGIAIEKREKPFALCTSSGTLGHSKSFGKSDAVSVLASSCALADAAATSLGNRVNTAKDIQETIEAGKAMAGVQGIVIIKGDKIGLWGDLKIVRLTP